MALAWIKRYDLREIQRPEGNADDPSQKTLGKKNAERLATDIAQLDSMAHVASIQTHQTGKNKQFSLICFPFLPRSSRLAASEAIADTESNKEAVGEVDFDRAATKGMFVTA